MKSAGRRRAVVPVVAKVCDLKCHNDFELPVHRLCCTGERCPRTVRNARTRHIEGVRVRMRNLRLVVLITAGVLLAAKWDALKQWASDWFFTLFGPYC